ncbi:MAG: hypothetical protein KKH72_06330 [Alphaproteobacteria bacterium]|nr:hypothetical protein [Alphaproteobacteria bacterium]
MLWLAELGLIVLALFAFVQLVRSGGRNGKLHEIAEERIAAYTATLRRTGANPDLAAMTDAELHDILGAAIRRLSAGQGRKLVLLVFGAIATVLVGIIFGVEDGWRAFAATLAIGGIALFGLERVLDRATRTPLESQGLDIERLRLD